MNHDDQHSDSDGPTKEDIAALRRIAESDAACAEYGERLLRVFEQGDGNQE